MPLIFAMAGWTTKAETWADRAKVALFDFTRDGLVRPHNTWAQKLFPSTPLGALLPVLPPAVGGPGQVHGGGDRRRTYLGHFGQPRSLMSYSTAHLSFYMEDLFASFGRVGFGDASVWMSGDAVSSGEAVYWLSGDGLSGGRLVSPPIDATMRARLSDAGPPIMIAGGSIFARWESNTGEARIAVFDLSLRPLHQLDAAGRAIDMATAGDALFAVVNKYNPDRRTEALCVSAMSLATGRLRWQQEIPGGRQNISAIISGIRSGAESLTSLLMGDACLAVTEQFVVACIVGPDAFLAGSHRWNPRAPFFGTITVMSAAEGRILWSMNDIGVDRAAIYGTTIIVRCARPDPLWQGYIAIDARTGDRLWELNCQAEDDPALAVYGELVVGAERLWISSGVPLTCFAMGDGELLWSQGENISRTGILWLDGRLWASSSSGDQVLEVDPEGGEVINRWPVPGGNLIWASDHRIALAQGELLHILCDE